jgi:hypothetical protein
VTVFIHICRLLSPICVRCNLEGKKVIVIIYLFSLVLSAPMLMAATKIPRHYTQYAISWSSHHNPVQLALQATGMVRQAQAEQVSSRHIQPGLLDPNCCDASHPAISFVKTRVCIVDVLTVVTTPGFPLTLIAVTEPYQMLLNLADSRQRVIKKTIQRGL